MRIINSITLTLIILGAINWGLIAFFQFDLVAAVFGGPQSFLARIVYGIVGLSGLYYLTKTLFPFGYNNNTIDTMDGGDSRLVTEFSEELDDEPTLDYTSETDNRPIRDDK